MGTSGEADSGDLWKMESLLSAGPRREKRHIKSVRRKSIQAASSMKLGETIFENSKLY